LCKNKTGMYSIVHKSGIKTRFSFSVRKNYFLVRLGVKLDFRLWTRGILKFYEKKDFRKVSFFIVSCENFKSYLF
jgi:hypothetical protein